MSKSFKKIIQEAMLLPRKNKYEKERLSLMNKYDSKREAVKTYVSGEEIAKETNRTVQLISAMEMMSGEEISIDAKKYYFVTGSDNGVVMPETLRVIFEYVSDNPSLTVCYGDEDYFALWEKEDQSKIATSDSRRCFRYYKPRFSPDTLCNANYIGAFAVKGECLKYALSETEEKNDEEVFLYELLVNACAWTVKNKGEKSIGKISRVLTSNPILVSKREFDKIQNKGASGEVLRTYFDNSAIRGEDEKFASVREKASEVLDAKTSQSTAKISILIPSKDNPEMLIKCIDRLNIQKSDDIEVIVADNGSSELNKDMIKHYLENREFEAKYIYEKEDFNYSAMNNRAAKYAKGEVLLLLNDDVEASGCEWIKTMASYALKPQVGCVGCKLLYPSGLLQHVGIIGGIDGPAHKYLGESDEGRKGFNDTRLNRNVLAVTGACLCVTKSKFDEAAGLCEELKIGYNDIDLCMTLYEKGYRNLLLNDIVHIHHESVSRGVDAKSKKKSERLRGEKEILKVRHKELMTADPYEGGKEDFYLAFEKESSKTDKELLQADVSRKETDSEGWIFSSFDRLQVDETTKFLKAKGYAVVPGIDNMRFDIEMLLLKEGKMHSISYKRCLRNDLQERFQGTENTELCGFEFECDLSGIESGEYRIAFYAKDHGNVRELVTESEYTITVN